MRDYRKIDPKYRNDTPLDARLHYAKDLLSRWCRSTYSTGTYVPGACAHCDFYNEMDCPKACGWALEADPEKAIRILEELLAIPYAPEYGEADVARIAKDNELETVASLTQEECAELIQAISKWFRYANEGIGEDEDHLFEEMADVSIMLDELMEVYPHGRDRVARWRDKKIERTLIRKGLIEDSENRAIVDAVEQIAADELDDYVSREAWDRAKGGWSHA